MGVCGSGLRCRLELPARGEQFLDMLDGVRCEHCLWMGGEELCCGSL